MCTRKIVAILASAALSVGFSGSISGCADHPPQSRPIMYGTNGNRGVTAPSQGLPQNPSNPLGGPVTSTPGSDRPNQTIVGPSAGVDGRGTGVVGTNDAGNARTAGDVQTGSVNTAGGSNSQGAQPNAPGTGSNGQGSTGSGGTGSGSSGGGSSGGGGF